jgi:hypothetical protein
VAPGDRRLLKAIKARIQESQTRAICSVNAEPVRQEGKAVTVFEQGLPPPRFRCPPGASSEKQGQRELTY